MVWLPVLGFFNMHIWMSMHAIAHTVRKSALKVNSGRKISCRPWDSNPHHYYTWPFSRRLYKLRYSLPLDLLKCSVNLFLIMNPTCCNDGKWDSLTKILSMPDLANHSLFDLVTLVTWANNLGAWSWLYYTLILIKMVKAFTYIFIYLFITCQSHTTRFPF